RPPADESVGQQLEPRAGTAHWGRTIRQGNSRASWAPSNFRYYPRVGCFFPQGGIKPTSTKAMSHVLHTGETAPQRLGNLTIAPGRASLARISLDQHLGLPQAGGRTAARRY